MTAKQGFKYTSSNPYAYEEITGSQSVALGLDSADSGKFKIKASATPLATPTAGAQVTIDPAGFIILTPATNVQVSTLAAGAMVTSTTGVVTAADGIAVNYILTSNGTNTTPTFQIANSVPATLCNFSVYLSATQTNTTGDNTLYTVPFNTKLYDVGTNYNTGTHLFTAPVNGIYFLNSIVLTGNNNASYNTSGIRITTSGNSYTACSSNNGTGFNSAGQFQYEINVFVSLTAGQTASVGIRAGSAAKTISTIGSGSPFGTIFQGFLVQSL